MLLGIVIDDRGLVPEADVRLLNEFGELIKKSFSEPLGNTSGQGNEFMVKFQSPKAVTYVVIMEDIARGERILEYKLSGMTEGKWQQLGKGSCIGHKRIEVVKGGMFSAVRLEVTKSEGTPAIRNLACYGK